MAARAIKPRRDDTLLADWQRMPERPPSIMRADTPTVARIAAFVSLLLLTMGLLAMVAPAFRWGYWVGPVWGFVFFIIGVGGLLFHAFRETDTQLRMLYLILGLVLVLPLLRVVVTPLYMAFGSQPPWAARFLLYGIPALLVGLILLLAVARNEPNAALRQLLARIIGVAGAVLAIAGFIGGNISQDYLLTEGVLLLLMGVFYLAAFIAMQEITSPWGYRTGLALGALGSTMLIVALLRSVGPDILYKLGMKTLPPVGSYLVPDGLMLMVFGLLYGVVCVGVCSDRLLVVLTRRELSAFFCSPIAYLVLFGFTAIGLLNFGSFLGLLDRFEMQGRPFFEPIVHRYFWGLIPIIAILVVVPVLTMRLVSEEHRTGTLEVLLTAPVNEVSVVLSKFLASFVFFLVTWAPWGLYLVGLRVFGGSEFDYRPLLSFLIALSVTGAGFLAMGLFLSSLTGNQIVAAVLTFAGMMLHLGTYFAPFLLFRLNEQSAWREVFLHVSFIDLWSNALEGLVVPRYLFFHVSAAVFFLFLTVKVLEARKWT